MRRDDWYRNTDWNADIESAFRTKLSRSRSSRPQYIQIQASQLIVRYPEVALALIGEYFETGDDFFVPSALCTQAAAYCNLGKTDEAVAAYKRALEWESLHPSFITNARIDLPRLVAEKRLSSEYEYALTILTDRFEASDHLWPNTRYIWNGSCALILQIAEKLRRRGSLPSAPCVLR